MRKLINVIIDEKVQMSERALPFEREMRNIEEPQDIIFLRFAEEEEMAQEKEGLVQLLEIDDFLCGGGVVVKTGGSSSGSSC